jgi:hypothetical protein
MDIVRIILDGYGCDVARGIITKEQYRQIEESDALDNLWIKGLYKKLGKKWERIDLQEDYGIITGDLTILVNDEEVLDLPTSVLESITLDESIIKKEEYDYPRTKDVVMTTVQYLSGRIADIMFITNGDFEVSKLRFITKDIHNEDNDIIIESLISEIYYDGEPIPLVGSDTDLRMSNIYFDFDKDEKR